jgi:4-hydroxy-tetrahydrodipicolinate reductase
MKKYKEYKPVISETHHKGKKDAPSGTAITLANEIIGQDPDLEKWINAPECEANEFSIISFREDEVPGTHLISYDSEIDSIELKHTAHSRKGFAFGALMAAEWLIGKQGCFSMKDIIYDEDFDK